MRVAVNAMQVRAAKSGVGQHIHALMEALLRRDDGTEYTVYASPENLANYEFGHRRCRTVPWGLPESQKVRRLVNEYIHFPAAVRQDGADLLHVPSNLLPPRKTCPYVVTIHDLSYFVDPARCSALRRHYWYAMTARTAAIADAVLTVSEHSRRDIETYFPGTVGRVHVAPNAAHPRFRPLGSNREGSAVSRRGIDRPYILYVGTIEPGKNLVRLVRAFDALAADFPWHMLVLIGDRGWLTAEVFGAVEKARYRDRICVLGHLPDDEVVEFLNFCEVFAFPSLYEGFGLPPLEAMACGAPVVSSAVGSLKEVVGSAALLVDPLDEESIAKGLERVLRNRGLARDLREAGLERARLFSWDRTAEITHGVYRMVAGG